MKKLIVKVVLLLSVATAAFSNHIKNESLVIGFMPYISPSQLLKKYEPLAEYLSKELHTKVSISIAKNYTEYIDSVANEKYDINFLGGSPYVFLADNHNQKSLLVRYEFKDKPTFRSVVFTAKNSKIESIKDLDGKKIALGNKKSTLSSQVPMYMIKEGGVDVDKTSFSFLKNHENVLLGVLFGEYDGGAIAEDIFNNHKERGLRAVGYSPDLSTHVFTYSSKVDEKDALKIKKALLELKDKKILTGISKNLTGFVEAKDSDYNLLREILKQVLPILDKK